MIGLGWWRLLAKLNILPGGLSLTAWRGIRSFSLAARRSFFGQLEPYRSEPIAAFLFAGVIIHGKAPLCPLAAPWRRFYCRRHPQRGFPAGGLILRCHGPLFRFLLFARLWLHPVQSFRGMKAPGQDGACRESSDIPLPREVEGGQPRRSVRGAVIAPSDILHL